MAKLINVRNIWFLSVALVLLQACASTEELFAEYDDNFCVVPEYPSQAFRWEPVVYFDSDSSLVREQSLTKLKVNVATLAQLTGYKISHKGFADHQGSDEYNKALSERRVEAVRDLLVSDFGIKADRVIGSSHGENTQTKSETRGPIDVDRRVEMVLLDPSLEPVVNQPLVRALQQAAPFKTEEL